MGKCYVIIVLKKSVTICRIVTKMQPRNTRKFTERGGQFIKSCRRKWVGNPFAERLRRLSHNFAVVNLIYCRRVGRRDLSAKGRLPCGCPPEVPAFNENSTEILPFFVLLQPIYLGMWQFLYFFPLPQGQGSFLPICGLRFRIGSIFLSEV
ncbi:MAG: hypothetical protein LBK82_14175 [Planctomycetaceae bacterium]|nr:hypothetical protein [Planctomycetaceae bacterium]